MKLIAILLLSAICIAGVKSAAIDGYNYDKPAAGFEEQAPAEEVAERKGNALDALSSNNIAAEVKEELAVDDIDLRTDEAQQPAAVEEAHVEVAKETSFAAKTLEQPKPIVAQRIAAAAEVAPQPAVVDIPNIEAAHEVVKAEEIVEQPKPVVEQRIGAAASEYEDHSMSGYNYEKPKVLQPLPQQVAIETKFDHQELGSKKKANRHGNVKRLKLKGPDANAVGCGEKTWQEKVAERAQVRPQNRRKIPYTEKEAVPEPEATPAPEPIVEQRVAPEPEPEYEDHSQSGYSYEKPQPVVEQRFAPEPEQPEPEPAAAPQLAAEEQASEPASKPEQPEPEPESAPQLAAEEQASERASEPEQPEPEPAPQPVVEQRFAPEPEPEPQHEDHSQSGYNYEKPSITF